MTIKATVPKNATEAAELGVRLSTLNRDVNDLIDANEDNWTSECEQKLTSMQADEDSMMAASEAYLARAARQQRTPRDIAIEKIKNGSVGRFRGGTHTPGRPSFEDDKGNRLTAMMAGDSVSFEPPSGYDNRFDDWSAADIDDATNREFTAWMRGDAFRAEVSHTTGDAGLGFHPKVEQRIWTEFLRLSTVTAVGSPVLNMTSDTHRLVKLGPRPTASWKAEGAETRLQDTSLTACELNARKLTAMLGWTSELAESDFGNSLIMAIQTQLQEAMAIGFDTAALSGDGSNGSPTGIVNQSGILSTTPALPVNGQTPRDVVRIIGSLKAADYPGDISDLVMLSHPLIQQGIQLTVDSEGRPMQWPDWYNQVRQFTSSAMPLDEVANTSDVLVYDPSSVVIGIRRGITLRKSSEATVMKTDGSERRLFATDSTAVLATFRGDICPVRNSYISVLKGAQVAQTA